MRVECCKLREGTGLCVRGCLPGGEQASGSSGFGSDVHRSFGGKIRLDCCRSNGALSYTSQVESGMLKVERRDRLCVRGCRLRGFGPPMSRGGPNRKSVVFLRTLARPIHNIRRTSAASHRSNRSGRTLSFRTNVRNLLFSQRAKQISRLRSK